MNVYGKLDLMENVCQEVSVIHTCLIISISSIVFKTRDNLVIAGREYISGVWPKELSLKLSLYRLADQISLLLSKLSIALPLHSCNSFVRNHSLHDNQHAMVFL